MGGWRPGKTTDRSSAPAVFTHASKGDLVSNAVVYSASSITAAGGGEGFTPPDPSLFELPPIFHSIGWLTKPMLMAMISVVLVAGFFLITSRKAAVVPGKGQFTGELAYSFVRNTFGRDMIGPEFMKYVPYLVALFFFILVNNVFGVIPFIQFPTFSHIGWAMGLTAVSWVVYNTIGIKRHGFLGYLKHSTLPSGVPMWLWPLIIPLEFASNILVRPLTLCLRLFANMFAGHLVLAVFALGGSYLIVNSDVWAYKPVGVLAFAMGIALMFLELLVQVLQAYIFTILTASYISGALAEEH
jgi:F-type H+-transporting ATPase subunit a